MSWARATARRQWWTAFAVSTLLMTAWSIATPLFASPDEPAHVIRAASLDRGQILGTTSHAKGAERGSVDVRLPAIFGSSERASCFKFKPNVTADCLVFGGSRSATTVQTTAGRHPPFWYLPIGLPSLVFVSAFGVHLMRLVNVVMTAAFLASAFVSVLQFRRPRAGALALAVSATPMLWFVGGTVNPSAVEIAAAISLWATGIVLVRDFPVVVDRRLLIRFTVAGVALVFTRQLGPLWIVLVAATLLWVGGRAACTEAWRSRGVRVVLEILLVAWILQMAWLTGAHTLNAGSSNTAGVPGTTLELLRGSLGRSSVHYREMIGVFGWLDTRPPGVVWLLWTAVLVGVVALALRSGERRHLRAILVTAVLTVVLPVVFEVQNAHAAGYFWQGRYTLPLAVGVPLLAVAAWSESRRSGPDLPRALAPCTAVALGVAQVLAFGQAIRRYAVGATGPLNFFTGTAWSPPLPAALLVAGFAVGCAAWYVLLLGTGRTEPARLDEPAASSEESAAHRPLA